MNSLIVLSFIKLIYSNFMLYIVFYVKYIIDIFFFNIYRWIIRMNFVLFEFRKLLNIEF